MLLFDAAMQKQSLYNKRHIKLHSPGENDNVDSKVDCVQLNLAHVARKIYKKRN